MVKRLERIEYLQKLIYFKDKQLIKVVTGVRRCGKSTLLEIFQDYLKANGTDASQILTINLENFDFFALHNPESLHTFIKKRLQPDKKPVEIINIGRAERPETQCLCGFQPFVCVAQLDRATAS